MLKFLLVIYEQILVIGNESLIPDLKNIWRREFSIRKLSGGELYITKAHIFLNHH